MNQDVVANRSDLAGLAVGYAGGAAPIVTSSSYGPGIIERLTTYVTSWFCTIAASGHLRNGAR